MGCVSDLGVLFKEDSRKQLARDAHKDVGPIRHDPQPLLRAGLRLQYSVLHHRVVARGRHRHAVLRHCYTDDSTVRAPGALPSDPRTGL